MAQARGEVCFLTPPPRLGLPELGVPGSVLVCESPADVTSPRSETEEGSATLAAPTASLSRSIRKSKAFLRNHHSASHSKLCHSFPCPELGHTCVPGSEGG